MFPDWTWIVGSVCGAFIGSFLNVVIYRMPRAIPLGRPSRSFCPKCEHPLGIPDLFPLLSWLFSGRKCRYCGKAVSSRYFWVELLTAAIWGGIWYQTLVVGSDPGKFFAYAMAASALVAIIFVDIELYLIPDQINAFILFVGFGYNLWLYSQGSKAAMTWGMPSSIAGALTGVAILWGIAFFGRIVFRKDAMGHGDIKMARGVGAVLFPAVATISFGLAVVLGAVIGIGQVVTRKRVSVRVELEEFFKDAIKLAGDDSNQISGMERIKADSLRKLTTIEASGSQSWIKNLLPNKAIPDLYGEIEGELEKIIGKEEFDQLFPGPESIASLLKCGLGYILCFDVIGLFLPKFYRSYFNEDPFDVPEDLETFEAERTMIPFGPYLALGAILAAVFEKELLAGVDAYLRTMGVNPAQFSWNTFWH